MKLIENRYYVVKDKNNNNMIWKFIRYETYTSLPTDCIFEHILGSEYLVKDSPIKPEFVFPLGLIDNLNIRLDITEEVEEEFFSKNIQYIKTRKCFTENLTVRESIISMNNGVSQDKRYLEIYEELLSLYDNDRNKYGKDIDDAKMKIEKIKTFDRNFLIKILETYDKNERFVDIVTPYL